MLSSGICAAIARCLAPTMMTTMMMRSGQIEHAGTRASTVGAIHCRVLARGPTAAGVAVVDTSLEVLGDVPAGDFRLYWLCELCLFSYVLSEAQARLDRGEVTARERPRFLRWRRRLLRKRADLAAKIGLTWS